MSMPMLVVTLIGFAVRRLAAVIVLVLLRKNGNGRAE